MYLNIKKKILVIFFSLSFFCVSQQALTKSENLTKKIGQLIIIGFDGSSEKDPGVKEIKKLIREELISGVLFYNYNIRNKNQTQKLIKSLLKSVHHNPLWLAIDQEGGFVQRLNPSKGFDHYFPSAQLVAQKFSKKKLLNTIKKWPKI